MVKVGSSVTYVDPVGVEHSALVTAVWSEQCINIVYVSVDETQTDAYGRKIVRETSLMKHNEYSAHGRYWK